MLSSEKSDIIGVDYFLKFLFFFTNLLLFSRSLRQKPRLGGQINYREEEKRILDSILGRDVYDNRIRPSGLNGTGKALHIFWAFVIGNFLMVSSF